MLHATALRTEYLTNPIGIDYTTPRFFWLPEGRGSFQTAYQIMVENAHGKIYWDSGRVESAATIQIEYGGLPLQSRDALSWRVKIWDDAGEESAWSEAAFFELGLLAREDWKAEWINPEPKTDAAVRHPAAYLRKEFTVNGSVERARLYITSCGVYEAYINGEKAGDQVLAPGSTSYKKRLQYQAYDVTSLVHTGANAIGAVVGDGWFRGSNGMGSKCNIFGENIALLCQLEVFTDAGVQVFVTDTSWKATQDGPIRLNDLKHGEMYDARMEMDGWTKPGYDDASWIRPRPFSWSWEALIGSNSVPVAEQETFSPRVLKTPNGETVLDFGQNMSGYVRFFVQGPAGHTVTLTHGEALDEDGNFTMENLESSRKEDRPIGQQVNYTLSGKGRESYKPTLSVFGFQYVRLTDWPQAVLPENFTAIAVYSRLDTTGHFTCSDDLVNQFVHNTLWSQKSNFLDIPTDCPTRERAGYTGDAQVFVETGSYLMDTPAFYRKWLGELGANQAQNGMVSNINPVQDAEYTMFDGSAGWGDAAVIIPWKLYKKYGDEAFLAENYQTMKRWVDYAVAQAKNSRWFRKLTRNPYKEYLWDVGFHWGEWLEPSQTTMTMVKNAALGVPEACTAFLSYSSHLLSQSARVLGMQEDAQRYGQVSECAKKAYQHQFVKRGRIRSKRQCLYVRPLAFGLLDPADCQRAADDLNRLVVENSYHLNTGFLSTPFICSMLSGYGHLETAYKLMLQKSKPGWLYSVTKGATTVWESWNGIDENGKPEGSLNHYSYGAVVGWLFGSVAGIAVQPNENRFLLNPKPHRLLQWAQGTYASVIGTIALRWEYAGDTLHFIIEVPANTVANFRYGGVVQQLLPGRHAIETQPDS